MEKDHHKCVSQVLLQPQFIKAESLLLTTLKHDPCMVTTVASPTSLATTTPIQSASLQVKKFTTCMEPTRHIVGLQGIPVLEKCRNISHDSTCFEYQ